MSRTVTFVVWHGLPAVFPESGDSVGGIETAAWQFAKGLAEHNDWCVQFVVRTARRRKPAMVSGVRVLFVASPWLAIRRSVAPYIDVPRRRIIKFHPSLIWKLPVLALSRPWRKRDATGFDADPRLDAVSSDIWIAWGGSRDAAAVVSTAKARDAPSLLMIRSAADLADESSVADASEKTAYGEPVAVLRHAIENATEIVCQASYQNELLRKRFGKVGQRIRNIIDPEIWKPAGSDRDYVLWVGRYETFHKRIDLAISIAERCPQISFRFVANPSNRKLEQLIRASLPSNVSLIDYVPHDRMPEMFQHASVFLCTGSAEYEGFPNVLLQAAATQTPIVSLEDFDRFIVRSASGSVVGPRPEEAAKAIQQYVSGEKSVAVQEVQAYLQENHSQRTSIGQLQQVLRSLG